jgi:predicted transcriptional regulator of viral defense system
LAARIFLEGARLTGVCEKTHRSVILSVAKDLWMNRLLKNRFAIDPAHKPLRNDITEHASHSASLVASARFSAAC